MLEFIFFGSCVLVGLSFCATVAECIDQVLGEKEDWSDE